MTKFVSFGDYATRSEVEFSYPGCIVREVEGGWMLFASYADLNTWEMQV